MVSFEGLGGFWWKWEMRKESTLDVEARNILLGGLLTRGEAGGRWKQDFYQ